MSLPGILGASLLVNTAIVVNIFTLFFIISKNQKHLIFFTILFFIDNSFAIFILGLLFFS